MMSEDRKAALRGAAQGKGIAPGYHTIDGQWHDVDEAVLERLLAMFASPPAPKSGKARMDEDAGDGETARGHGMKPCHLPAALRRKVETGHEDGPRPWGLAVQLYGLTSERNWGIGDFSDLTDLCRLAAACGAEAVQINPLHALFPDNPDHVSPYAPSSRLFLNPLYIDVMAIPELAASPPMQARIASPAFQQELARLRALPMVDHAGVLACKMPILRDLFATFMAGGDRGARGQDFRAFCHREGRALEEFALFEALSARFHHRHPEGWTGWPEAFRTPSRPGARDAAIEEASAVAFSQYLQWIAHDQLHSAQAGARDAGMAIGLILDIAIGASAAGADSWRLQDWLAMDAEIGAPPDPFAPEGQRWGTPPLRPDWLEAGDCLPLRELMAATMREAGGVRIDHVIGLARQFWVPRGLTGRDGAYVVYPMERLLASIAEASQRFRCLVIGEDLGTVPEGFRERIQAAGILSTRVLLFERGEDGRFLPPEAYPAEACACAATHDLPPLAGFLASADIHTRAALDGSDPGPALDQRRRDIDSLSRALAEAGLDANPGDPPSFIAAIHRFLGQSPAALVLVQMEDILHLQAQANLPGTIDEHPNWRRKYPVGLERLAADGRLEQTGTLFAQKERA